MFQHLLGDCQRYGLNAARPSMAPPRIGERKQRHQCAGLAIFITKIEVMNIRLVKIHGPLHKTEPEHVPIKSKGFDRIDRHCGDMVQADRADAH